MSFALTLDTTAPQITWGAVSGTTAGELLTIGYTLDEPSIVSATIEFSDHSVRSLDLHPDRVETLLPPDAPDGLAVVTALVRDEVLNEATHTLEVLIGGVIAPPAPEPAPTGGFPARTRPVRGARHIRSRTTARLTTRARTRQELEHRSTAVARSRATIRREDKILPPPPRTTRTLRSGSVARVHSGGGAVVRLVTQTAASTSSRSRIERRPGPDIEAAFILDLL